MTDWAGLSEAGFVATVPMTLAKVVESEGVESTYALVKSETAGAVVAEVVFAMAMAMAIPMAINSISLLLVFLLKLVFGYRYFEVRTYPTDGVADRGNDIGNGMRRQWKEQWTNHQ